MLVFILCQVLCDNSCVVMDVFALMDVEQVYLGEQYVNSSTLSDVTFLVEGVILCTALLLNSYQYSLMVARVA